MISTVKREIAISKELHSKIEWACTLFIIIGGYTSYYNKSYVGRSAKTKRN